MTDRSRFFAFSNTSSFVVFSHFTSSSMILNNRFSLNSGVLFINAIFEPFPLLVSRVIHKLCKDDCTGRRKWSPCPPKMQGAGVPMPNGFFACRCRVDRVQRQRNFNEFLGYFDLLAHTCSFRFVWVVFPLAIISDSADLGYSTHLTFSRTIRAYPIMLTFSY